VNEFVDTHCHLNFNLFETDMSQVLDNAWQAGVRRILMPGIDLPTSRSVIELSERYPWLYAAVGVHPNDALTWGDQTLQELRTLALHPRVLAIGEIGLDFYRDHAPRDVQLNVFSKQLALAAEIGKPVIIHSRQSLSEVWPLLKEWQLQLLHQHSPLAVCCGVLHSYEGDLDTARQALDHGFFIGISGPVTFKNAPDRQKLVAALPLEGLLLETDAPFLAPQPVRGRRNEPAFIPLIAEKIAELHTQNLAVVAQITTHNSERLLGWRSDR
jgi:TatD DNase family protein